MQTKPRLLVNLLVKLTGERYTRQTSQVNSTHLVIHSVRKSEKSVKIGKESVRIGLLSRPLIQWGEARGSAQTLAAPRICTYLRLLSRRRTLASTRVYQ